MFASRVQFCDTHGIISANQYGGKDRKGTCVMKKKVLGLAVGIILVLAFGMAVVSCPVGNDENGSGGSGSGSGGNGGGGGNGNRENIFDFQRWMKEHNEEYPRTDLPLPANTDAAANPSHLGGRRNHGQWPFWNTGNQDIVIEGPVDGRDTFQMAVPGAMTGGLPVPPMTNYGQHGVSFRLSGPDSLNAQVGDRIRITGYIRGSITATFPFGPGVALRHHGVDNPWGNFHYVRWAVGLLDHPFEISWVLRQQEFNSIPGSGFPTLTVVREPSQLGVIMVIQHFEVLRLIPQDPD